MQNPISLDAAASKEKIPVTIIKPRENQPNIVNREQEVENLLKQLSFPVDQLPSTINNNNEANPVYNILINSLPISNSTDTNIKKSDINTRLTSNDNK